MSNESSIKRANYGLDAPNIVRRFFVIGLVGLIIGTVLVKFGPGHLPDSLVSYYGTFLGIGACFVLQGIVMTWGSKVGKLRLRDKMIDSVSWRGDEQVLDVGCGHGLMLIGAAKRLTNGRAIGIDIWQSEDQASNSSQATLENALREGGPQGCFGAGLSIAGVRHGAGGRENVGPSAIRQDLDQP